MVGTRQCIECGKPMSLFEWPFRPVNMLGSICRECWYSQPGYHKPKIGWRDVLTVIIMFAVGTLLFTFGRYMGCTYPLAGVPGF